jgi:choline dehydrogenase-like flavoprotein
MNKNNDTSEFDYVIVGAGSAGCVLANRLSADGRHSVLLLEAGPKDTNLWIHVPLGYGKLFKEKSVNWMYQTEPEPGLNGRQVFQPRGKVLGGSSSINGLLYVRGQHEDYDRWRQRGNAGWGYDDVLPYFKKAENQQRGPDKYHGADGPLPVSDWRHHDPLSEAFVVAAAEVGIPTNPDFNGATQEGAGFFQTTTNRGRRASTAFSYLRPAQNRSNLHVETSALAASVCQLRPESRGSLRIKSADPSVPPEIRINYLATETDRRAFIDGIRILRNILAAPALKPYAVEEVDPGLKVKSDDELLDFCRRTGSTVYHPTSTCRMGSDPLAVVDQRLCVRGIEGLRIVDASIMPDLMSGNTNAPTIMIAEKASDMILEDAR